MMEIRNLMRIKFWCILGLILLEMSFLSIVSHASGGKIAETYTGSDTVTLYIRGIEEVADDISAQIGTSSAAIRRTEFIKDSSIRFRTLILIDNSNSIKKDEREQISDILKQIVMDKKDAELISIATFADHLEYLTDYSDDGGELGRAIGAIEYADQETCLTDALYNVYQDGLEDSEQSFYRIIVISDGDDNKEVGSVTREELFKAIDDRPIPIYTIGCSGKKNDSDLDQLASLSRETGVAHFRLSKLENNDEISAELQKDRDILCVEVVPEDADMDGSSKVLKVTLGDDDYQIAIRMPQNELVEKEESEENIETEEAPAEQEVTEKKAEPEKSRVPYIIILVLLGLSGLLILIVLIIVILRKRANSTPGFETFEEEPFVYDGTEEHTVLLGESRKTYVVVLEDVMNPAHAFQFAMSEGEGIILGRKKDAVDICIDYDMSISGKHCQILLRNDQLFVRDLQSSNGTFVNENKVVTEAALIAGNTMRMGSVRFRVILR